MEELITIAKKLRKLSHCHLFWKGHCFIPKDKCYFAHGLRDMRRLSHKEHDSLTKENPELIPFLEDADLLQSKLLFEHQINLPYEEGIDTSETHSVDEDCEYVDSDGEKVRPVMRKGKTTEQARMRTRWQRKVMNEYLMEVLTKFEGTLITKDFVEKEFFKIRVRFTYSRLKLNETFYEKRGKLIPTQENTTYLFKFPETTEQITTILKNRMVRALVSYLSENQEEQLPVYKKLIMKQDYSTLGLPDAPLAALSKLISWEQDDIVDKLVEDQEFRLNCFEALRKELPHRFSDLTATTKIFEIENVRMKAVQAKVAEMLANLDACQNFYLPWAEIRDQISAKDLEELDRGDEMKSYCIDQSWFTFTTPSSQYLIHIPKIVSPESEEDEEKKSTVMTKFSKEEIALFYQHTASSINTHNRCFGQMTEAQMDNQLEEFKAQNGIQVDAFSSERNIVVVDNWDKLEYALSILRGQDWMGVDIEGRLRFNGFIELVQIGVPNHIFVFDFVVIDPHHPYREMFILVLKYLFEDENRVKVFHDGRRDSEALHCIFNICPKNIVDTSPGLMLFKQLEMYSAWLQKKDSTKRMSKTFKFRQLDVATPGLNTVLSTFRASHGVNNLKEEMHKAMGKKGVNFRQRPIDPDFLSYAAQDVEDLVEVGINMLEAIIEKSTSFGTVGQSLLDPLAHIFDENIGFGCQRYKEKILMPPSDT